MPVFIVQNSNVSVYYTELLLNVSVYCTEL